MREFSDCNMGARPCGLLAKPASEPLPACDWAVWIGLSFLTMGLLFGALWAKERGGTTGPVHTYFETPRR